MDFLNHIQQWWFSLKRGHIRLWFRYSRRRSRSTIHPSLSELLLIIMSELSPQVDMFRLTFKTQKNAKNLEERYFVWVKTLKEAISLLLLKLYNTLFHVSLKSLILVYMFNVAASCCLPATCHCLCYVLCWCCAEHSHPGPRFTHRNANTCKTRKACLSHPLTDKSESSTAVFVSVVLYIRTTPNKWERETALPARDKETVQVPPPNQHNTSLLHQQHPPAYRRRVAAIPQSDRESPIPRAVVDLASAYPILEIRHSLRSVCCYGAASF